MKYTCSREILTRCEEKGSVRSDLCLSVIVPAYNDYPRLGRCIFRLIEFFVSEGIEHQIVIACDGSSDLTLNYLRKLVKSYPQVSIAYVSERLGKGGGILNAYSYCIGNLIMLYDVDMAMSPREILKLVRAMEETSADLVVGSRNLKGSIIPDEPPIMRKLLGKAFNTMFRWLFRIDIHDTQCGYKLFKKTVLEETSRSMLISGYAFDVNLLIEADTRGYKIVEVPITWSFKKGSKLNLLQDVFNMAKALIILWLIHNTPRSPVKDKLTLRKFYDNLDGSAYYQASRTWFLPRRLWHRYKNAVIVRQMRHADSVVLDCGCGSGETIASLVRRGHQIVGIDIGENFCRFSASRFNRQKVSIVRADMEHLPFRPFTFDHVICSETIEHVRNPMESARQIHFVLKHRGNLLLTTPSVSIGWTLIEFIWTRLRKEMLEIEHHLIPEKRLYVYLHKAGFRDIRFRPFMFGFLLFVISSKR